MKDYSKFIEEQLNTLMPFSEIYEENKTLEYPVKDAPKVSGYFGFIGLKYMKRVRNIKKLCVEYINTYVDGSLNVLRKMDKTKTLKGAETLATEIEYGATGFNTNKKEKRADSKVGVAFLTSDKAILDKLKSIENQIKIYASKSAALTEWATLMVQKSNMIGAQIVYDKASETLDENDKKRLDEEIKTAIDKKDKELEEYKKKTEEKIKGFEKYGDVSQMNHDVFSKGDIEKIGNTDYKQDLEVYGNDTELGKNRMAFYSKNNWNLKEVIDNTVLDSVIQNDVVQNILNSINNDNDKEKVENVIKNYATASYLAKNAEVKKSNQYLSPYDLQILAANLSGITNIVKKETPDKSSILKNAEFGNLAKGDDLNKIKEIQLDNEKMSVVAAEWKYTFGEESTYLDKVEKTNDSFNYNAGGKQLNETKHYVMGWNEFLNEHLLKKSTSNKTVKLNEMSGNFEVNMDDINIQDKCIANGDGIYAYFSDHLSEDANRVFVVKNGKVVMPSDMCLEELKIDDKWRRRDNLFDGEIVFSKYNDSEYYGTIGFKHGMEILKKYYPRLKTYYCNVGYHTFPKKWYKTDKDSVYAKECDDMINIVD